MPNKQLSKPKRSTTVLVTGGAGYIGSHTLVELLQDGYEVVVIDDLSNSSARSLDRVREIVGLSPDDDRLTFVEGSILDDRLLDDVRGSHDVDAVIHFAGYKAVGESVERPLDYYWNNVAGTLALARAMRDHGVKNLIFSSSATVYGEPESCPITEMSERGATTNPYGSSKSMLERILMDLYTSDPEWNIVILRYFNPIGAHESGLIGEDPKGIPNNLLPYVSQVAVGNLDRVGVFGDDYDTPDGTGVRDYIHVVDLAKGHAKALDWMAGRTGTGSAEDPSSIMGDPMEDGTRSGVGTFNLGTGEGHTVLEVIDAYSKASGKDIPYEILPRREGDVAVCYASCEKARRELGWEAERDLDAMCRDSWHWQSSNPDGYR